MSLARITHGVEAGLDIPLPCTLETLSKALKGAGPTYKRARFSLKQSTHKVLCHESGKPHWMEPRPHCKRSVLGALDFAANTLRCIATAEPVTPPTVMQFLDQMAQQGDGRMAFVVLDNAHIHHGIGQATLDPCLKQRKMLLFYLPTIAR